MCFGFPVKDYLKVMRGVKFNPELVDTFLKLLANDNLRAQYYLSSKSDLTSMTELFAVACHNQVNKLMNEEFKPKLSK